MPYTEKQKVKIINTICKQISAGKSLRGVLRQKEMPDAVTFYKWIDNDDIKLKQYARATSLRSEVIFEDIMEIADSDNKDTHRDRLKVDTRKWMLSKMNPKKYGEKLEVDQTVTVKEQPLFSDEDNK